MKKLFILSLFLFVIASCADALTEFKTSGISDLPEVICSEEVMPMTRSVGDMPDTSCSDYPYTREEDSLYIESLGWKIRKIYEDSLCYLVNGELLFMKEDLLTNRNSVQERLFGNKINPLTQRMLLSVYYIDGNTYEIFKEAVAEWNAIEGCNIYFAINGEYEYSTEDWYDVEVSRTTNTNLSDPLREELELGMVITISPSLDGPAIKLQIDPDNATFSSLSSEQKKYAIMHALGHVIKLDDADEGNTTIEDSIWNERIYTIMNMSYFMDDMYNCTGFSYTDQDNLAAIYPIQESIIHGVKQNVTSDPQLPVNTLKQYKTYEFTSEPITPKRGDEDFYCEYEVNGPSDDYVVTMVNDTTASIRFNTAGTYRIRSILKSHDINGLEFCSEAVTYNVINDVYSVPVSDPEDENYNRTISLGTPFELQWIYADRNYPDAEIVVSGMEYYFGDGSDNIEIDEISNGKVSVTLNEYGRYRITMKAVTPGGQILKVRRFLINEFWHPNMWVAQDDFEFYYTPVFFEKQRDIIYETPLDSPKAHEDSGEYIIMIGRDLVMRHNFYADLYMSYHRQYEEFGLGERRMDVRYATEAEPFSCIEIAAGSEQVAYGPLKPMRILNVSGECGVPNYAYANYYGHAVVIIPDDSISIE